MLHWLEQLTIEEDEFGGVQETIPIVPKLKSQLVFHQAVNPG